MTANPILVYPTDDRGKSLAMALKGRFVPAEKAWSLLPSRARKWTLLEKAGASAKRGQFGAWYYSYGPGQKLPLSDAVSLAKIDVDKYIPTMAVD